MNTESITVLIPTKNRKALLDRALVSIFSQSIAPEEIIVINDGSTDGTKEFLDNIALEHSNLRVMHREKSGGVNTARNQAMKEVSSKWIAWLDDDDEFFPEAISTMKDRLQNTPETINLAFFNSLIDTGKTTYIGGYQFTDDRLYYDTYYEELIIKKGLRGDCKPVFRKSLFADGAYQFPETVNGFESYTVYLIVRDGKGVRYYRDVLTHIHLEASFDHLSFSASRKNPFPLLVLQQKQLVQHADFYRSHPESAAPKYKAMAKLAIRSRKPIIFLQTSLGYFLSLAGLLKNFKKLPGSRLT